MGQYYTPKRAAIRFANNKQAILQRLTQSVESTEQVPSDHISGSHTTSGVIRKDIDSWKKHTTLSLFPPTISDVVPDWVDPNVPQTVYVTGSNFVPDSQIFLEDVLVTGSVTYLGPSLYSFTSPVSYGQFGEIETGVTVTLVRPDGRSGSIEEYFFYEHNPVISNVTSALGSNVIYNDGDLPLFVSGSFFKRDSTLVYTLASDPEVFVSGNNSTWETSQRLWTFTPRLPVSGVYDIPITGSYYIKVVSPSGLESNTDKTVLAVYRPPIITEVAPNFDIINSETPAQKVRVAGANFLPEAEVYVSTSAGGVEKRSLFPGVYGSADFNSSVLYIDIMPTSSLGTGSIYVKNPEDGQQSNAVDFLFILPTPVLQNWTFDPTAWENPSTTGSAGISLYLSGTSFSGTVPEIAILPYPNGIKLRQSGTQDTIPLYWNQASLTSRSLTATMPSDGLVGDQNYDLILTNGVGSFTASSAVYYRNAPRITAISSDATSSISPTFQIDGIAFYPGTSGSTPITQVYIGGRTGTINSISSEQNSMIVVPPAHTGSWTAVDVFVRNYEYVDRQGVKRGLDSNVITNGYLYSVPPTMTLSPSSGSAGGCQITATIQGFKYFDGAPLPGYFDTQITRVTSSVPKSRLNSTQAILTIPSGPAGMTFLTATNGMYNQSLVFSAICSGSAAFEYVAVPTVTFVSSTFSSASLTSGRAYGISGTLGSITGTNFAANATQIFIGGIAVPEVTWVTSESLAYRTPFIAAGGVKDVSVTSRGVSVGALTASYTYVVNPFVSSSSPAYAVNLGVSNANVSGTNFIAETKIVFSGSKLGGIPAATSSYLFPGTNVITASANSYTASSLVFNIPAAASGVYGKVFIFAKNYYSGAFLNESPTSASMNYEVQPTITAWNVYISGAAQSYLRTSDFTHQDGDVWVTGTGIIPNYTTVTLGNTTITLSSSNGLSCSFTPPVYASATLVNLYLSNGSVQSNIKSVEFRSQEAPRITSVVPVPGVPSIVDISSSYIAITTDQTRVSASVDNTQSLPRDMFYYVSSSGSAGLNYTASFSTSSISGANYVTDLPGDAN